ncbi:hypothetical protein QGN29_04960 [Temperatibacter marinus]|uniref:Methyltransferase n=1 Tax=Temperatibacter marinus TaxID=1456591 RepID=A0AA52HBF9_9PROT|nr:hypothetical protein [Temperatibacter marinus]WND03725.1 hypothetical protein QGN29_04960 [Temperatibacter marinus]
MKNFKKYTATLLVGLTLGLPSVSAGDSVKMAVEKNGHRVEGQSARDSQRHPEQVLKFFGIDEKSTVIEVNPGGMWYSRILGPLLKQEGLYIGLEHHPASYSAYARYMSNLKKYRSKMKDMNDVFGDKAIAGHLFQLDSPVKPGSVDTAMVVRAMHNWERRNFMAAGLNELHGFLKEGGTLGVVQHREPESSAAETKDSVQRGRWKQSELIKVIEAHGFKLVEASEINANPKDKEAVSVWTLPPRLAGDEEGKAARKAIGESDRMTLKFVKVAK